MPIVILYVSKLCNHFFTGNILKEDEVNLPTRLFKPSFERLIRGIMRVRRSTWTGMIHQGPFTSISGFNVVYQGMCLSVTYRYSDNVLLNLFPGFILIKIGLDLTKKLWVLMITTKPMYVTLTYLSIILQFQVYASLTWQNWNRWISS